MVIGSFEPRVIGEVLVGLSDVHGNYHPDQRGVVVREATSGEYLAQLETPEADTLAAVRGGTTRFYVVATD